MKDNYNHFYDLVSASILALIAYPIIQLMVTQEYKYLYMLVGLIFTDILTKMIKHATINVEIFKRPSGACRCNLLSNDDTDLSSKPGMPSGHLSVTSFFIVFLLLTNDYNIILIIASSIFIILMSCARYFKKCHSIVQIISGLLFGGSMGKIFSIFI